MIFVRELFILLYLEERKRYRNTSGDCYGKENCEKGKHLECFIFDIDLGIILKFFDMPIFFWHDLDFIITRNPPIVPSICDLLFSKVTWRAARLQQFNCLMIIYKQKIVYIDIFLLIYGTFYNYILILGQLLVETTHY